MPSILIVDDEPGVRSALGGVLRDEGYNVDAVESGEACLDRLSRRVFDAAPGPKRYVPIVASHHNDPALYTGDEMLAAVTSFLDEWLAD